MRSVYYGDVLYSWYHVRRYVMHETITVCNVDIRVVRCRSIDVCYCVWRRSVTHIRVMRSFGHYTTVALWWNTGLRAICREGVVQWCILQCDVLSDKLQCLWYFSDRWLLVCSTRWTEFMQMKCVYWVIGAKVICATCIISLRMRWSCVGDAHLIV